MPAECAVPHVGSLEGFYEALDSDPKVPVLKVTRLVNHHPDHDPVTKEKAFRTKKTAVGRRGPWRDTVVSGGGEQKEQSQGVVGRTRILLDDSGPN